MVWKNITAVNVRILGDLDLIMKQHALGNDGDHSNCLPAPGFDLMGLSQTEIDTTEWNSCLYKSWELNKKHKNGDHSECIMSDSGPFEPNYTTQRWDSCPHKYADIIQSYKNELNKNPERQGLHDGGNHSKCVRFNCEIIRDALQRVERGKIIQKWRRLDEAVE